jgi:hypothetical protein
MVDLIEQLSAMSKTFEEERAEYESAANIWWNSLSQEDRERAFYIVVAKIVDAELRQKGSYRYVLYDVFGFDPSMYAKGMDCGFMALHNALVEAEDLAKAEKKIKALEKQLLKFVSREELKELYDD